MVDYGEGKLMRTLQELRPILKKIICSQDNGGSFCGNKMVEDDEECDCGFDDEDCDEQCCFPKKSEKPCRQDHKYGLNGLAMKIDMSLALMHRLRSDIHPGAVCSPSQGPCCTSKCRFVPKSENLECKAGQECTLGSVCNGRNVRLTRW